MAPSATLPEQEASLRQTLLSPVVDTDHSLQYGTHGNTAAPSSTIDDDDDDNEEGIGGGGGVRPRSVGCWSRFHAFRRSPTAVVLVVSFALLVDLLVYTIIVPVLPLFVEREFDGSSTIIGVLFASFAAGLLVCTPVFAYVSDRNETRRLPMLAGLACLAASTVLFGISTQLWQLVLARIMQGASAAATNTIGLAMISDVYAAKEIGSSMGLVMSVQGLGALIGPPLGGALYDNVSFLSIFLVCGGCAVLDLLFRLILIDDQWMARQRRRIRRQDAKLLDAQQQQPEADSGGGGPPAAIIVSGAAKGPVIQADATRAEKDTQEHGTGPSPTDPTATTTIISVGITPPSTADVNSASPARTTDAAAAAADTDADVVIVVDRKSLSPSSSTATATAAAAAAVDATSDSQALAPDAAAASAAPPATPPSRRQTTSEHESPALMSGLVPYRASVSSPDQHAAPEATAWAPAKTRGQLKHVSRPSMAGFYDKVDGQVDADGLQIPGKGESEGEGESARGADGAVGSESSVGFGTSYGERPPNGDGGVGGSPSTGAGDEYELHRESSMAAAAAASRRDAARASSSSSSSSAAKPHVLSLWAMLSIQELMITQLAIVTLAAVFTGIEPLLALHFNDAFGSSSSAIGYSEFAIAIPYAISSALVGGLIERYNKKLIVAGGFLVMAVSLGLFDLPRSLYTEIPPMIGVGVGMGLAVTPPLSEIAEYLARTGNHASFAMGYALFNLSYACGMFGGPLLSGALYDHTTFFVTMMVLVAMCLAVTLLLIVHGMKEVRQERHRADMQRLAHQYNHPPTNYSA